MQNSYCDHRNFDSINYSLKSFSIPCICNQFKQSDIADIERLSGMHQLQYEKSNLNYVLSF
jgi:hypothetical protein